MNNDCFFKAMIDNLYDGVYFVDVNRRITYWNQGSVRLTGYEPHEVVGSFCMNNILDHVSPDGLHLCTTLCPLAKTLADGNVRETHAYLQHKAGQRLPVYMRVAPIRDKYGTIIGAVEIFGDDSRLMVAENQVRDLLDHSLKDPLTEVLNRRHVEISLDSRLEEARRFGWDVGVLFADIDNFKRINDEYGHQVGDQILCAVAQTFAGAVRPSDLVGRWGGDEFLGVLANITEEGLYGVAERVRKMVAEAAIRTLSDSIHVTVSIGGAVATDADDKDSLIRAADLCLYESKSHGRNRVTLKAPSSSTPQPLPT